MEAPDGVRTVTPHQPDDVASTRNRLIEAARNLFLRQGYAATGIAQILREADAKSGSLYHFFPTKEDLLLAVLAWYRENLYAAVLQPVWERIHDPVERVFGVLDGYRQMLLFTECGVGCPIGNLALEVSDALPAAREMIAENFENWRKAVRFALEDGRDRFPEDVDFEQLSTFVLTTMEGGVMLARAYRTLEPFDASVSQLRDYVERLLADGTNWSSPKRALGSEAKSSAGREEPSRSKTPKTKTTPARSRRSPRRAD